MTLLNDTRDRIVGQDGSIRDKAKERLDQLTMPYWALGRLMDLAVDLAGITRSLHPQVDKRVVVVMAGDHGVVQEGVTQYPQEVTCQMVLNFLRGGAGINAIAKVSDAQVVVVNMGVTGDFSETDEGGGLISRFMGPATGNIAVGPAMSREDAIRSIEAGIDIATQLGSSFNLFATGDMGIGNTTPSSAIVAAFTGAPPEQVTGRGTGIDEETFKHKISIVEKVLSTNNPDTTDGIDVLAKVGGFEIGGIAGLILGVAAMRKPVLIDGFISTAGALIAHSIAPSCADYMIASHQSVEQGHRLALNHLNKRPLLDLDLRLGEGTGAALAMPLVEAAVRILTEVATFDEASVSRADK
ncbi:MAG TPA: nicotinate-nucleotide--dimethylbenzimidazole phosphoribosyltransferase [Desulfomonilaceae bacterium]|nr:nicotinate-nucleotide--dimethylbenzimidazole phosphoribosyltransferase [Desulfomonilaceae bacterium]